MKLAPSPISDGYVPCGACNEYVEKCPHYKRGHLRTHKAPVKDVADAVREQAVRMADGYCQTCGVPCVLLHVRPATHEHSYTTLTRDDAVAICADCRIGANGKSLRRWVQSDPFAPDMARRLISERLDRGLPV